jgi:hypothetical protein
MAGSGGVLGLALILLQFAVPFALLLFRRLKRDPRVLAAVAGLLLFAGWLNIVWLVSPSLVPSDPAPRWTDVAATIGIGGLWTFLVLRDLALRPAAIAVSSSAASGSDGSGGVS